MSLNSDSPHENTIHGVERPAPAVESDAASNESSNSAASNYGQGSSVAGSRSAPMATVAEEKKKSSKKYWTGFLKK
ncbi:hypothetical protein Taro_039942 [Colocasia esculenta]|uniref:Uncharacterized protein n=1 Tax=Colocasia esculenta TaxID=4460 RepID=A0A843WHU1_COLES|nr:hypothetical protein [Colocasia esculenta]